ncbi:MAG: hypothetical protein H6599_07010 [Flavobacteriales bacterium]|nr:hypothetical protein [Flavobacteriales bacterium]
MAKVKSILEINGSVDKVVIYSLNGKQVMRSKVKGLSEQIKTKPSYEGQRQRTKYCQIANSFGTAVYRMAKEFAYKVNYKTQSKMNGLIYQSINKEDPTELDYLKIRRALRGIMLNFKDTESLVDTVLLDGDVIINCDKELQGPVSLKVLIGTLPEVKKVKGEYKADINMMEVEVVELTLQPEDHHATMRLNLGVQPNQIVVAIVHPSYEVEHVEWVKVI